MAKNIENKSVVVTGGASGIGYSIVENLIKYGAKLVIIIDINEKLGNKAVNEIKEKYRSDKAVFIKCDVTSDLEMTFEYISSKYKNIDLLVNNAGILDEKSARNTISINLTALVEWSMKFYDYMRRDRNGNGGTIINIASIYGIRTTPFLPIYNGSKFGVVGFTKSLGHEYNFKKSGVRVIAVCPGFTHTQLAIDTCPRDDDSREDFIKDAKSNEWQEIDSVGEGIKDVIEKADNSTVWLIEGSRPPALVKY